VDKRRNRIGRMGEIMKKFGEDAEAEQQRKEDDEEED